MTAKKPDAGYLATLRTLQWMRSARCKNYPGDRSDFVAHKYTDNEAVQRAIAWCQKCPVKQQCADYARYAFPIPQYGVWGGVFNGQRSLHDGKSTYGK